MMALAMAKKTKVAVAMSGGVDSSFAAAQLKKQGFEVIGAHFSLWKDRKDKASLKSAKSVAKFLNIPLYVLNMEKEFKKEIVDYFISEYKKGRTPNPCVKCNKVIKFGRFFKEAKKRWKADYIATGHYARIVKDNDKFKLMKGADVNKDQSYFLYNLNQHVLSHTIFPNGNYEKEQVKKIAEKMKLPVLQKKESQEICFISYKYFDDFLKKFIRLKPGNIRDEKGNILGRHKGLQVYTAGQRRNVGLPGGPWYVIGSDFKKNELMVSRETEHKNLMNNEFIVEDLNWVSGNLPKLPLACKIRARYRQEEMYGKAQKTSQKGKFSVKLSNKLRAVMPGQSAVFYKESEILGGGVISKIIK